MKNFHDGKMQRVANYFRHSEKLEFTNSSMYWPGGTVNAPKGRPDCGFDNEFCVSPGVKIILSFCSKVVKLFQSLISTLF